MTEPSAKTAGEIRIIGKAAGIGDLAEGLARSQRFPAMYEARGAVQTNRLNEIAAGRAMCGKEFLEVA